ncbi:MAG: nucleotidyltransferase family protein [Eubacteriales bacterium]|nr:nucleotidyltransferase family protein [Eubacteriales bacterium]
MRICGIVAEYNPFHSGHEKHIELTRKKTGADIIICVMSGPFVQRGEPAVFDKWTRAACALLCGADAVIELPLLFAVQSAEGFASGGVAVLDAAGADYISFGCETDDLDLLSGIAQTLCYETQAYKRMLKEKLSQGISFPEARMKAAFPDAPDALCLPNAILGIEYLKAIQKSGSKLTSCVIKRIGGEYHSTDIGTPIPSATSIRKALSEGHTAKGLCAMPDACAAYLSEQMGRGLLPVFPGFFDKELIFTLRRGGIDYIKTLPDVSEGLENRIYEAAGTCTSREALIKKIKTKRYTYTRISRILLYALLGITKKMIDERNHSPVDHIRVLGVRRPDVLSVLSDTCTVPVVTSAASLPRPDIGITASDIYALTQNIPPFCAAARDYTEKLIF